MAREAIVRSQPSKRNRRRRVSVGEITGGAAADCTAVCCCCPLAVLNFFVLAVYTVPTGLFKKAVHWRRRRILKNNACSKKSDAVTLQPQRTSNVADNNIAPVVNPTQKEEYAEAEKSEAAAFEKEMWARFAGTGFWRSESRRQP